MTIRELYDWANENNAVDLTIEIPYRDDDGFYIGSDGVNPQIETRKNKSNSKTVVTL